MGKENPKSLFLFQGRIGNIIAYVVNGKTYYRRKPEKKYFPHTEKQLQQRTQFLACQQLALKVMDDINKKIWNKLTKKMTGFNLFKKTNYHNFDHTGRIINYENLTFSKGPLMLPKEMCFIKNESVSGGLTLIWENERMKPTYFQSNTIEDQRNQNTDDQSPFPSRMDEFPPSEILSKEQHFDPQGKQYIKRLVRVKDNANPSDWLRIIALSGTEAIIVEGITAKRSDKTATFQLPWANDSTVHLYAWFIDENNNKSTDTFYQSVQLTNQ